MSFKKITMERERSAWREVAERGSKVTVIGRDCNPGLEFSIPGFGIVEFPIPGSRDPVGIGGL